MPSISSACDKRQRLLPARQNFFVWLHEKGGKEHEVPVHHKAEEDLDAYIEAAGIGDLKGTPLFRTFRGKGNGLVMTANRLNRKEAWYMIQRRASQASIRELISTH